MPGPFAQGYGTRASQAAFMNVIWDTFALHAVLYHSRVQPVHTAMTQDWAEQSSAGFVRLAYIAHQPA
jgi:hypothetical protein